MKKNKTNKVFTVEIPKQEAPETSAVESIIASLASMQASAGWAVVVKILNDNIKFLETAILEKVDPITKEKLTDAEVEVLRTKRSLNIDLRDTPQNYSKVVKDAGEVPVEYDPYFKTMEEIQKAKQTPGGDDRGR
jgi:outer membrane receptor for ferric coprogen and ferric-rhodotorulic acid